MLHFLAEDDMRGHGVVAWELQYLMGSPGFGLPQEETCLAYA